MRHLLPLLPLLGFASFVAAQDLRRGLVDADAVVVARQVAKTPFGEDIVMHRLEIIHRVRGADDHAAVTVLDWPKLALHQRPTPRQSRLYCLQDASEQATRLGLPATEGPFFKMVGWPGSNPLVGDDMEKDPTVRFAALLARSEAGAATAETATELCATALTGAPVLRTEAARHLSERPVLRAQLSNVQWSHLLARASGEIDDVPHKIALAELCAEQHLDGLLDALIVSLGPVQDAEYARTVGRIGKLLDGEAATEKFEKRLKMTRQPEDRAALLLAMGASNTDSALEALLRFHALGEDAAVDAALREHKSPRAKEAVTRKH